MTKRAGAVGCVARVLKVGLEGKSLGATAILYAATLLALLVVSVTADRVFGLEQLARLVPFVAVAVALGIAIAALALDPRRDTSVLFHLARYRLALACGWRSAASHRRKYVDLMLARDLEEEGGSSDATPTSEAAINWLKNMGSQVIAANVLLERTGLATVAALSMPLGATLRPQYAGVGDPESQRLKSMVDQGIDLMSEGRTEQAIAQLRAVAEVDSRIVEAPSATIELDSYRAALIQVDGRRGTVSVLCYPSEDGRYPALVALVSISSSGNTAFRVPQAVTGSDYRLAEFEGLLDGDYVVEIGPLTSDQST